MGPWGRGNRGLAVSSVMLDPVGAQKLALHNTVRRIRPGVKGFWPEPCVYVGRKGIV